MQVKPEKKLLGHTKEGFGLNWSQLKEGYLLSGSNVIEFVYGILIQMIKIIY